MRCLIVPVVLSAILGATAASASSNNAPATAEAPSEVTPAPDSDADKVKCKSVRGTTSLIPTRVCKTKAQWAAEDRNARETMEYNQHSTDRAQGS